MNLNDWVEHSQDALILANSDGTILKLNASAQWVLCNHFDGCQDDSVLPIELQVAIEEAEDSEDKCHVLKGVSIRILPLAAEKNQLVVSLKADCQLSTDHGNLVFDNNVAGIYEVSLQGELITFNHAFATILGYEPEELDALHGKQFYVHIEERQAFLDQITSEKRVDNFEIRYQRKDESIAWCMENAFLIESEGQDRIIGTMVDITEQKRLTDQYEALYVDSSDAIFVTVNDEIIRANTRCHELFGYAEDELKQKSFFHRKKGLFVVNDQDVEYISAKVSRLQEGDTGRFKLLAKRKDGTHFHCEINYTLIKILSEKHLQLVVRDISERVFYEEALKASEARFRMLSEVAIEGVIFVLDQQIRDCNRQFAELFGYKTREEIMGRSVTDFIGDLELKRLEQILDIRRVNRTEIRSVTKDGKSLVLEATGSKIEHRNKEYQVYLVYDITGRKRAEQALEQSTERFKSVVEFSPNGIFILTDGEIRYVNASGLDLLGFYDEDDIYRESFPSFFKKEDQEAIAALLERIREGEKHDVEEFNFTNNHGDNLTVGLKATLSVYDGKPSVQITLNNLTTRMKLMQETLRAQLAEEINVVLKREIEQHKKTQLKLSEAENFVRNIIESSIDMIIAVDKNDLITEFNSAAQQQFGYSSNEMIGQSAEALYADLKAYQSIRDNLRNGKHYSGEIENVRKNGKTFTSFLSASFIRDEDGNIVGSMGVSRDVTEFKKAERELRESEERYRDLFENATDFIFAIDENGRFQYANQSFIKTLGYSLKELKKLTFTELVQNDEIKASEDLMNGFANKTFELNFIRKDGGIIETYGDSSIREKEGEPNAIRAIYRDITALRAHERTSLEQAARLESIFNSTENLMMWTLDLEGKMVSWNHNFEQWMKTGLALDIDTTAEFVSQLNERVNPDAYQNQLKYFQQAVNGKAQQFELPLIDKQGEGMWIQVFLNPVKVGESMGEISCIANDITDRKEIDRKILDSLKEKEVLLQEVHHRVKNNLQVISSILNLQSSFVDDDKTLELLEESQQRIKTMSYIHESLYQNADFSNIEFTEYVTTLTRNLIQSYSTPETEVKFNSDFDEICLNLDQAIPCGLIINELVSNALKYAFEGRKHGKLTVSAKQREKMIEISVADDGVGLPADFNYEESESLGIYLVYALVEQLDASIEIERESGTRFLVTFEMQ